MPPGQKDNTKVKKAYNWAPKRNIKKIVSDIYVWLKKDKKKLTKYLYKYLYHENSIIRGSCIWSLFELENKIKYKKIKEDILKKEKNNYVLYELNSL